MLNVLRPNMAPPASRILRPGVRTLAPHVERYPVPGAGSVVVAVGAGDQLLLTDTEGGQRCEVLFCDMSGQFDLVALGAVGDSDAAGLKAMLAGTSDSAVRTLSALRRRNIDLGQARATCLFGGQSPAGNTAGLTVARDGLLTVAAPGADMSPAAQDTATGIELRIIRAQGRSARAENLHDKGIQTSPRFLGGPVTSVAD
jgi:aminomethyltransferase